MKTTISRTLASELRHRHQHPKRHLPPLPRQLDPYRQYQPPNFMAARHWCRAPSEKYRTMKSLSSASLHDDSRRQVRSRCIDFETHTLARAALKTRCRDGMGKRRDPAIRVVLHFIA